MQGFPGPSRKSTWRCTVGHIRPDESQAPACRPHECNVHRTSNHITSRPRPTPESESGIRLPVCHSLASVSLRPLLRFPRVHHHFRRVSLSLCGHTMHVPAVGFPPSVLRPHAAAHCWGRDLARWGRPANKLAGRAGWQRGLVGNDGNGGRSRGHFGSMGYPRRPSAGLDSSYTYGHRRGLCPSSAFGALTSATCTPGPSSPSA